MVPNKRTSRYRPDVVSYSLGGLGMHGCSLTVVSILPLLNGLVLQTLLANAVECGTFLRINYSYPFVVFAGFKLHSFGALLIDCTHGLLIWVVMWILLSEYWFISVLYPLLQLYLEFFYLQGGTQAPSMGPSKVIEVKINHPSDHGCCH